MSVVNFPLTVPDGTEADIMAAIRQRLSREEAKLPDSVLLSAVAARTFLPYLEAYYIKRDTAKAVAAQQAALVAAQTAADLATATRKQAEIDALALAAKTLGIKT